MNSRPNPFERLMNDLRLDSATPPWEPRVQPRAEHPSKSTTDGRATDANPVTQADVRAIHAQIDVIAKTAEFCDKALADALTAQGHQIKALEEAICPRVAARLQSLEKAVVSLQGLATMKAPAAAPERQSFLIMGVRYTDLEARVATLVAGGPIRFSADFKKAREIIALVRAQQ